MDDQGILSLSHLYLPNCKSKPKDTNDILGSNIVSGTLGSSRCHLGS